MKKVLFVGALLLAAFAAVCGCRGGSQGQPVTKSEEEHLKNPSKVPPPEAANFGRPAAPAPGKTTGK